MSNTEVIPCDTVQSGRIVVQFIVCKNQENSLLSLLALYYDCVATEEAERLHNIV